MSKPNEKTENVAPKTRGKPFRGKDDKPKLPPKNQLNVISQFYLNTPNEKYSEYEMEAKFGTRGIKPITKLDYDNVVKKLKSLGYSSDNEKGSYSLKIQPEFLDVRTGEFKTSSDFDRFRVEISGLTNIQEYCRTNNLKHFSISSSIGMNYKQKTFIRFY